jgi:putative tryptophan/tyrosine transport system substrate-binding protein
VKRREFIAGLGVVAWPLAAQAQQRPMPVIGFVMAGSADAMAFLVSAFRKGLSEAGYVEGRNVTIEFRWAEDQFDRLPALAAELVERRVAVIVTNPRADSAAKNATATIPIVFVTGSDPVSSGLVASLNRPGGNLTGVVGLASGLSAKRFGLLHDLVPHATLLGFLSDSTSRAAGSELQELEMAARHLGVRLRALSVGSEREFDAAFATFASEGVSAVLVGAALLFLFHADELVTLAARYRIPTMYEFREYVVAGGLVSYATNQADLFHQCGVYAGRILAGEKPADLPVLLPTKFEFAINLKTAKALGLTIPPNLLAIADEVIE